MTRHVRLRELLVGIEGLALLRHLYDDSDEAAGRRLGEIRRLLEDDAFASGEPIREADPEAGYSAWAESYDEPGNPIVALEQPAVWSLLEPLRPGRALDAACGTGRHARRLVDLGHDVLGVDLTPEMLERAAANVPEARFERADLRKIPAGDGEFDLVVCGLALAHLPELDAAVAELARVLRPGGTLIVSVLHPFQTLLGWHARFADADGRRGFVREHPHTHADYLDALGAAGLELCRCLEPQLDPEHPRALRRAFRAIPEATTAAYAGLPGVLVWHARRVRGDAALAGGRSLLRPERDTRPWMKQSFAEAFAAANPRLLEAFNAGDFETALAGLAPDVQWHTLPNLPDGGLLTSRAAAIRFFRGLLDSISWRIETLEIIDAGDRCVVVHQRGHQVGRTTGIESSGDFFQIYEQREDGLIGRIREFPSRESALAAAATRRPPPRGTARSA